MGLGRQRQRTVSKNEVLWESESETGGVGVYVWSEL